MYIICKSYENSPRSIQNHNKSEKLDTDLQQRKVLDCPLLTVDSAHLYLVKTMGFNCLNLGFSSGPLISDKDPGF